MRVVIISHRGFWKNEKEKNALIAFQHSLENGYGIETDLRDYGGEIVISHDIADENSMLFSDFMLLIMNYPPVLLALNIKSDGLQQKVSADLRGYKNYFVFDMSIPDALGYQKQGITNYTRFSDIEPLPALTIDADGVWLDNFGNNTLNVGTINEYVEQGKKIALVSPELHKFEYAGYWQEIKSYINMNPKHAEMISICTDFPEEAQGFFNEE